MKMTYNSIADHEGYKEESAMLQAIDDEIKELESETIPGLKEQAEQMKQESLKEGSTTTWQDVEQVKHDIEKWQYRADMLHKQRREQVQKVNEQANEARKIIVNEAEQAKIEALHKSLKAYELLEQAHNENKTIDRYQSKALQLTGRDLHRTKAKIPVDLPNPAVQNVVWDIWLKKARAFLENKKLKKSS